jgi:hypothetical protein
MPFPASYIQTFTAPLWNSLTNSQRSDWHFFANDTPITNDLGEFVIVNGWQMFNHVNSWLAVTDDSLMLSDPPADLKPPAPINLNSTVWPIKSKLADASTWRSGRVFLSVDPALPSNRLIALIQATTFVSEFSLHPFPRSKSTFIPPSFSGLFDLTTTAGFQSSNFQGLQKKRIIGPWASHHPRSLVAKAITVSTENGMRSDGAVTNSRSS